MGPTFILLKALNLCVWLRLWRIGERNAVNNEPRVTVLLFVSQLHKLFFFHLRFTTTRTLCFVTHLLADVPLFPYARGVWKIPFSSNAATVKTLEGIKLPELFHILTIDSFTLSPSFFCQLLWCIQGPSALLNGCWGEWREFEPNAAVWNLLIRGMPPNTSKPQIAPLGINRVFHSLCCVFDTGFAFAPGKAAWRQ